MTSPKDPIRSLIAEIDGILNKPSSRKPWPVPSEAAQQRRVLERVRDYLASQQQKEQASFVSPQQSGQETAQQIAQLVAKELESLRVNLMQPLQVELEALRRERESLLREIRQMENRASHYHSLAQQQAKQQQIISDFLQVLMSRLQESLTQQVAKTMANLETLFLSAQSDNLGQEAGSSFPAYSDIEPSVEMSNLASPHLPLHPRERLEQLQQIQAQSDRMLLDLDSTLRVVLEALQRNVIGYQESLSQGVAKMHNLGQQSEVLLTAFVNHVAQQLGREISAYMPYVETHQVESSDDLAKNSTQSGRNKALAATLRAAQEEELAKSKLRTESATQQSIPEQRRLGNSYQQLPFPGMEWPPQQQSSSEKQGGKEAAEPPNPPKSDLATTQEPAKADHTPSPQRDTSLNQEAVDFDFDNLGIEPLDSNEIDTILQFDIDAWVSESPATQQGFSASDVISKTAPEQPAPRQHSNTEKNAPGHQLNFSPAQDLAQGKQEVVVPTSQQPFVSDAGEQPKARHRQGDTQPPASSDSIGQELDDLYTLLFGSAPLTETVETEDFESLVQGAAFARQEQKIRGGDNPPATVGQQETPPIPQPDSLLSAVDSANEPEALIEDALFAGCEDKMPASNHLSVTQPTLFPESWEEVLFYEDATPALTEVASPNLAERSLGEQPEGGETISVLTDLFDDRELRAVEEIVSPLTLEEVMSRDTQVLEDTAFTSSPVSRSDEFGLLGEDLTTAPNNTQELQSTQQTSFPQPQYEQQTERSFHTPEGVEDIYIPASPEENLLTTEHAESEPDIKLLLDRETLQRLSEDLSSFEFGENQNLPVPKQTRGTTEDANSRLDHISQSSGDSLIEQAAPEFQIQQPTTGVEYTENPNSQIPTPESQEFAEAQAEASLQQASSRTYELLAEDWENLASVSSNSDAASLGVAEDLSALESNHTNLTTQMDVELVEALYAESIEPDEQSDWLNPPAQSHVEVDLLGNPIAAHAGLDSQTSTSSESQTSQQVEWSPDIFDWEELNWDLEGEISREEVFSNWTAEQASANFELPILNFELENSGQETQIFESDRPINQPNFSFEPNVEASSASSSSNSDAGTDDREDLRSQNQTSRQLEWNSDIFPLQDLNWDLEEELREEEEAFENWILNEAETNFVQEKNFELEAPNQEAKTVKSERAEKQNEQS